MSNWSSTDAQNMINEFAKVAEKVYNAKNGAVVQTAAAVVKTISGNNVTVYPLSGSDTATQYITIVNYQNIPLSVGDFVWINYWGDYTNAYLSPANKQTSTFPVGSVFIQSTNTNPSSFLGGTWSLIDKEFIPLSDEDASNSFTYNTEFVSSATMWLKRAGHELSLRFSITTAADLGDSNTDLGTINQSALGVTDFGHHSYFTAFSDGGGAFVGMSVLNGGIVRFYETVNKSGSHVLASGNSITFTVVIPISQDLMVDSMCNKFYFKRTA